MAFEPGNTFTNTSPTQPSKPTGIPDPNNPGYDTAGFILGSTVNADGTINVPNQGGEFPGITHTPTNATPTTPTTLTTPPTVDWPTLSTQQFGAMPAIPNAPAFSFDAFQAPAPFAPPSSQDVLNGDPGYAFRTGQGLQALQQSAAARGVLNSGGTLQDLVDYGQKAASQEYQNAYDRALGSYQTNFRDALDAYMTNFGNALTKYNTNYGTQYATPYNQMWQQYQQGVGNQAQLFNQQFQTATA